MIPWAPAAVRAICAVTVLVAVVVLAGWTLGLPLLVSVVVGGGTMKPVTALCLMLVALSLWLRQSGGEDRSGAESRPPALLTVASAAIPMLLGTVLLLEHLLRINGSIGDVILPSALAATGLPNPGRPSVVTALSLAMLGVGLLVLDVTWRRGVRPAQMIGLAVVMLGLIGVEGYLFGMEALFRFPLYARMALHTSILLLALGVGLLLARPDQGVMRAIFGPGLGSLVARRLLPVAVLLPLVLAWPRLQGERLGLYETEVGLALFATSNIVIFTVMIWLSARRLNRVDDARGAADLATRSALRELEVSHRQLEAEMAERARAEAEAHASEERFQVAFRASPAGMALLRLPDQTFVSVNESWLAMMDLTASEVVGRTADDLRLIDAVDRDAVRSRAGQPGTLLNADIRFRTSTGALRHGLISTQIVQVGGLPHVLTTLIDITDRVYAEQELRDANLRLEATLSELRATQQQLIEQERIGALGQLASGIAHDFNNALGPILGYSDLLLEEPALLDNRAETLEYLRAINTAAQGAAGVVARLRDFYRRRQNGDGVGPIHVPDVIAQAISLTRPRWKDQAQARGLTIDIIAEVHEAPPLNGRPAELRDALVNLILNAVDALERDGEISIRAWADGAHVLIEVADTGVGMSEDVRRQCLQPFFTTKGDRGTGLGLGLVQGTVQRLGGLIEIESAAGQGTTIRLRLPSAQDAPAVSVTEVARQGPTHVETARTLRVLVVDDEPMVRDAVRRFLEIDQHRVDVAPTGIEAGPMLATTAYDLIITDRAMPGMGGDELAQLAKRLHPTTPVLMLTGFGDLMTAAGEQPDGVDLVLSKPTTLGRLRAAIAVLVPESDDVGEPPGQG